ncbi:MAG: hypothetical protein H7346_04325 [Burkholderiaceae bacterium]|nr:hypothetical protein [Burkholderiaceae bacterium]
MSYSTSVDFAGKGKPETFSVVELRSPVRTGEQYNILDRRYTDTGIDVDGDKKPDALDVAVYTTVIGMEALTLPNLPPMNALRVDMTLLTRVQASSNQQFSPVVRAEVRSWYVEGLGLVQQVLRTPSANTGSIQETTEQLIAWDGLTTGVGAMNAVEAKVPDNSAVLPGTSITGQYAGFIAATATADHVLVFTSTAQFDTAVYRLDLRGQVVNAWQNTNIPLGGKLLGHPAGALYVGGIPELYLADGFIGLRAFDERGQLSSGIPPQIDLKGSAGRQVSRWTAALDDNILWLAVERNYYRPGVGKELELGLRPYSRAGIALAAETILETGPVANVALTAQGGRMLVTWTSGRTAGAYVERYASVASAGASPVVRDLVGQLSGPNSLIYPFLLKTGGALIWPNALGSGLLAEPAGVRLDGTLASLRSGSGILIGEETLTSFPAWESNLPPALGGGRFAAGTITTAALWPDDALLAPQAVDVVTWLDTDTSSLTQTKVQSLRSAAAPNATRPYAQFLFGDRMLLLSGNYRLSTKVVWLPKPS